MWDIEPLILLGISLLAPWKRLNKFLLFQNVSYFLLHLIPLIMFSLMSCMWVCLSLVSGAAESRDCSWRIVLCIWFILFTLCCYPDHSEWFGCFPQTSWRLTLSIFPFFCLTYFRLISCNIIIMIILILHWRSKVIFEVPCLLLFCRVFQILETSQCCSSFLVLYNPWSSSVIPPLESLPLFLRWWCCPHVDVPVLESLRSESYMKATEQTTFLDSYNKWKQVREVDDFLYKRPKFLLPSSNEI